MVFETEQQREDDPQSWRVIGHVRIAGAAPATYNSSARRKADLLPEVRYETVELASGLTEDAAHARLEEELAAKVREQEQGMARHREEEPASYERAYGAATAAEIFAEEQTTERRRYEAWLTGTSAPAPAPAAVT